MRDNRIKTIYGGKNDNREGKICTHMCAALFTNLREGIFTSCERFFRTIPRQKISYFFAFLRRFLDNENKRKL